MIERLELIDRALFLFINGMHTPFFDAVMWFVSGKYSWIPLYVVLLYILIKHEKKHWWLAILSTIMLIVLADQSSVHLFKETFQRYRPCHNLEIQHLVHKVNNKCGGTYGFVSSHATNVFALTSFLSLIIRNKYMFGILLFWAVLVSYSRIYLGVHYPADIIGGSVLGTICGVLVFFGYTQLKHIKKST